MIKIEIQTAAEAANIFLEVEKEDSKTWCFVFDSPDITMGGR